MRTELDRRITTPVLLTLLVRWGVYPAGWCLVLALFSTAFQGQMAWQDALIRSNEILIVGLIVLERLVPLHKRWGATRQSFITDLKYIVMNGAFLFLVRTGLAVFSISLAGASTGPATQWPWWLQLISAMLIFEALQYSVHRYMHKAQSRIGLFFWRLHSAHHLPRKLYVTMHAVGHPLNGLLIQSLVVVLPAWWMGYGEPAITGLLMMNGLHGLIAHFNVDVRMGFMNYIFVGTELHRYHHSSALKEAQNFGALLSIFDQLFGSFVYRPGDPPDELGAISEHSYPSYHDLGATLRFPFTPPIR